MPKLKYILLAIFLFVPSVRAADQADFPNIYISNAGSGTGVGSEEDPYADLDEINWTTGGDNSVYDSIVADAATNV